MTTKASETVMILPYTDSMPFRMLNAIYIAANIVKLYKELGRTKIRLHRRMMITI